MCEIVTEGDTVHPPKAKTKANNSEFKECTSDFKAKGLGNETFLDVKTRLNNPDFKECKSDFKDGRLGNKIFLDVKPSSSHTNELPNLLDESSPRERQELTLLDKMEGTPGSIPDEVKTQTKIPRDPETALQQHADMVHNCWPDITTQAQKEFPVFAKQYENIKNTRTPNYLGARIQVQSDIDCDEWDHRLHQYHDKVVCKFLRYGWPLGYSLQTPPVSVEENHSSAVNNMEHVRKYIEKELKCKAILGPFESEPFEPWSRISPIMTRPKRDSEERRIILDLSFPVGKGVNQGISTYDHLGYNITYSLPTINDLTDQIKNYGKKAYLWKADMTRAYRQLRADPLDAPLLGMKVDGKVYIDRCPPFGCRSSAAFCQRVANSVVYMMAQMGYKIVAYLDDFAACCDSKDQAQHSYEAFLHLADRLGLQLASHKSSAPTKSMEWLGYAIDVTEMRVSIPQDKLQALIYDCTAWLNKKHANKRMVQSIAGRLIYVGNCIRPARKFTVRILQTLRGMNEDDWVTITKEFASDIKWFVQFATASNGYYLFNPIHPSMSIYCDSSLYGGGGLSDRYCYTWAYSQEHMDVYKDIHHLEAINILVAYQTLASKFRHSPAHIVIRTDNIASSFALTTGKTKDPILGACARQLWLFAAINNHHIEIKHIPGEDIPVADALSRMSKDRSKTQSVVDHIVRFNIERIQPVLNNYVFFDNSL